MRKVLFTLVAVTAVAAFTASTASAQCTFDLAGKAKGLKSDMTRGYVPCGSGITYASPNTSATSGTPGCFPPVAYSSFLFSDKGKCSVKSKAAVEVPCSTGTPGNCSNIALQGKCAGLTNADAVTPVSGPGWALNTLARATLNDKTNGQMTLIDFPASFAFPDAAKGKLKLKSDTHTLLALLFGPGNELAACTSLELLSVKIVDPLNRVFATMGTATQ